MDDKNYRSVHGPHHRCQTEAVYNRTVVAVRAAHNDFPPPGVPVVRQARPQAALSDLPGRRVFQGCENHAIGDRPRWADKAGEQPRQCVGETPAVEVVVQVSQRVQQVPVRFGSAGFAPLPSTRCRQR